MGYDDSYVTGTTGASDCDDTVQQEVLQTLISKVQEHRDPA